MNLIINDTHLFHNLDFFIVMEKIYHDLTNKIKHIFTGIDLR